MPVTPAPPTLEFLLHKAIDIVIKNNAGPTPAYVLVLLKTVSAHPESPTYQVAMAAMKLALSEAFLLASENAKLTVCTKAGIHTVESVTYDGSDSDGFVATVDMASIRSLEMLFK